jgi:protein-S-isoprenylcysteine O-methyltransferase Ste14
MSDESLNAELPRTVPRVKTQEVAGVIGFPPLLVGVPLVVGLALQQLLPIAPLMPELRWFGAAVAVLGLSLVAWTLRTLNAHRTHVSPFRPTSELVMTGPFVWSRNPAYLGLCLAYLGIGFAARAGWVVLFFPLVAAVLDRGVIQREERYLRRLFGAPYDAYCNRVRRWI